MRPEVCDQVATRRERLPAHLTDERLQSRVRTEVHSQVTGCREGLGACLADVRLGTRVRP
jgi:hypothetical protein